MVIGLGEWKTLNSIMLNSVKYLPCVTSCSQRRRWVDTYFWSWDKPNKLNKFSLPFVYLNIKSMTSSWYILRLDCHHHHHVVPLARISLTLSRHFSLSFITSGRSSGLHPVSSHSCWMYVRAGRPAFARPYMGVHWSTSLMISSLLLQHCPACLVRLTWIVFVMGGRWPYSWCLVGCCR